MTVATRRAWDGGIAVDFDTSGGDFDPAVVAPPAPLPERDMVAFCIDSVSFDGTDAIPVTREVRLPRPRQRIVVDGVDMSFTRGVQTPTPEYALQSPLLYGSGMLSLPQFHAAYEHPGAGDMSTVRKDSRVKIQRVDADNNVTATDFISTIDDFRHDGRVFSCILAGEAVGPASTTYRPMPIFPQVVDVGTTVMRALRHQLRLSTANEPNTGVEMMESGGSWHLDWLNDILAKSDQRDGTQWTVMPNQQGKYRMSQKDAETIDATAYIDGFRVEQSLRRDFTQEFNRVWAQGVNPDGMRERFAIFPGLLTTDLTFGGSTLHAGDSGDDVTAMIWRLYTLGWLDEFPPDEWTVNLNDPVTDAIKDLQDDAGLSINGDVNAATWKAIFRGDNLSLRRSQQKPAAHKPFTDVYLRDGTGNIIGDNPAYDKTRRLRDAYFDMGAGFTRRKIQKWSKGKLRDPDVPNWVGTITVNTGAVISGVHNPSDALTTADIMDVRDLKPGMNLWLANWYGGTLVHISGVTVSDASVQLAVDTQARDTMPVWEVIHRNQQSAKSPARIWKIENRSSHLSDDTGGFYDGGPFGKVERTFCPGGVWTVLATPAGRSGTLQLVDIETTDSEALFGMAIFGKEVDRAWCVNNLGNPFTNGYESHVRKMTKTWQDNRYLVDVWGWKDQPCGYWPEVLDPNAFNLVGQTGSAESTNNTITIDTHGYHNGQKVYFASGSVPPGLTADNDYFVINATTNTFKVSATEGGSPMDITSDASGVVVNIHVDDTPPVTGEFRFKAGSPFFCAGSPVLWICVRPDRDTWVKGGRPLKILLDDAAG